MDQPAFSGFEWANGKLAELDRVWPTVLHAWDAGQSKTEELSLPGQCSTYYGFADRGPVELFVPGFGLTYWLHKGMFFVAPFPIKLRHGRGVVIERQDYHGFFQIGGPIEHKGRLRYIDGCTDSLIASPPRKGDPCLNLLYFPPDVDQTRHVHPSDRVGIILSGHGRCIYGEENLEVDLIPGMIFCIHTNGLHKFQTPYGEEMRVLAYHPETDFGPDDEAHPMLNRTIIEGVSAAAPERAEFRTGADVETQGA
jgi:mannose-6-phosphate isomerase-like protein (cupin superfamily)